MRKPLVVVAIICALVWIGCAQKSDSPSSTRSYPAEMRSAYLESCIGGAEKMGDKAKPYCECTLKKIEKKYDLKQFMALAVKMQDGDIPDEFMTIVKSCL